MSLQRECVAVAVTGFPRVSGDEPAPMALTGTRPSFSPRERG